MVEADFIPFVAPRVGRTPLPQTPEAAPVVEEPDQEPMASVAAPEAVSTEIEADESPPPDVPLLEEPKACDHRIEIRNEAIRLAAIACGRALRHALVLHPGIIAAFVDDALAAAGNPEYARVRVHPDCLEHVAAHRDRIGDEALEVGDVVVEFDGLTLGAGLLERSRLLVSSADA